MEWNFFINGFTDGSEYDRSEKLSEADHKLIFLDVRWKPLKWTGTYLKYLIITQTPIAIFINDLKEQIDLLV